jgi:hypothetical protein
MNKFWTFIIALIAGLVGGSLISELLKMVLPTGVVKDFLTYSVNFGMDPVTVDLAAIKLTLGLTFSFTIFSLLFIIGIVYYFKWWMK